MAISVDYLTRQTGSNLSRNLSLSVATVLTVAVSLSLLGASLAIQRGVASASDLFRGDVDLLVWMNGDASQEQIDAVGVFLEETPTVASAEYIDKEETLAQFQEYFADEPETLNLLKPEELPTRYEVSPRRPDLASIRSLGADAAQLPGVNAVDFEEQFIQQVEGAVSSLSRIIVVGASISGFASAMIMYNTIRTGLYARRKEIEVMRLVGATKWFIRLPYMLEGLIQGLIGAAISTVALLGLNQAIRNLVSDSENRLFRAFALSTSEVFSISILLFVMGAILGAIAAGIAVTRYLDA